MESTVLVKAFRLLESLGGAGDRSLGDLAGNLGMSKPTAHRVLSSLVELGYVQRRETGVYRLTDKLRRIAPPNDSTDLLAFARPVLVALHKRTGETTNLGVLRGSKVEYLLVLESTHALRRVVANTDADPFHCTSLGRAIVAHLPPAVRDELIAGAEMVRRTPKTVTQRTQLRGILDRVRETGYAIEEDETDVGVVCVGAPVFDRDSVCAAVSVSVPTARADGVSRARLVQAVRKAARQITHAIEQHKEAKAS